MLIRFSNIEIDTQLVVQCRGAVLTVASIELQNADHKRIEIDRRAIKILH